MYNQRDGFNETEAFSGGGAMGAKPPWMIEIY